MQRLWYPPHLLHASGSGLGIKRAFHEKIGGFDETLSVLEDTDYWVRLQLAGVKFHFVPNAVVHDRHRRSFGGMYRQARLWAKDNVLLYKRYGAAGVKASQPWGQYLGDWKSLLQSLPHTRGRGRRAVWVRRLGRQIGRLQGSLEHRVPPV